jgi:hypothetical protein
MSVWVNPAHSPADESRFHGCAQEPIDQDGNDPFEWPVEYSILR